MGRRWYVAEPEGFEVIEADRWRILDGGALELYDRVSTLPGGVLADRMVRLFAPHAWRWIEKDDDGPASEQP